MNIRHKLRFLKHNLVRLKKIYKIFKSGVWFVDVPRTSSSSIKVELGRRFGRPYGKINLLQKDLSHRTTSGYPDHRSAVHWRKYFGNIVWYRLFTFSIIRNPWDRFYSAYQYIRRLKKSKIFDKSIRESNFYDYTLFVQEFIKKNINKVYSKRYPMVHYPISDLILDENDRLIIDFVVRYENRQEDLEYIAKRINCPGLGNLKIQDASPKGIHYTQYYDSETKAIVEKIYRKDIELFDYSFGD